MNVEKREARFASVGQLLDSGYLWLARDLNGSIAAYSQKPFKLDDERWWFEEGESKNMWMDDGDLYNFVKWEDEEPVNIREWLEKEEEEMKMYSVKDGELECREVDADFFEKNTTLGGLLTSDEVELDRDNRIVTDAATIKVTAEKAKEIREALEMATDYGYKPSVSIMVDQFEYANKMPRQRSLADDEWWNYDSEVPKQLSLADLDNVKVHDRICLELNNIYEKKNADYGNSFENSLDKHGMIAGIVRMDDKMSRLISLNSKKEQQVLDESLRDTLMDLANYAIMSVMWLDEQ